MKNLEQMRKDAGLTQAQLAELVDVTQECVSRWETGERSPMIATAFKIATVLNCTIDDLIKEA